MNAPLYVQDPAAVVRKRGGRIVVQREGTTVASAPLMRLSEVVLLGPVGVTTQALHALLGAGVPVVLLRGDGRALGRVEPPGSPHVLLRQMQLARAQQPEARIALGRAMVTAKIRNQRVLLIRRAARSGHADELLTLAARCGELARRAAAAESVQGLLGIEGSASGAYFRGIRLLAPRVGFRRRDRAGGDVLNALVNYCSALLRETVIGALAAVGLDPHVSFLHTPARGRPTLAFDLMEEWRPVLVEATVLALLGLGSVTEGALQLDSGRALLTPAARTAAIQRFRARLDRTASSWPPSAGGQTYAQRVHAQARLLRGWVRGDRDAYEGFRWR